MDKDHKRIGIAWIEGNKISKELAAKGYKAVDFGSDKTKDIVLTDGSVARLNAGSGRPQFLRGPQENGDADGAYLNTGLVRELGRQTEPLPAATGTFIFASVAGGYAVAGAGPLVLLNSTAYAVVTADQMARSGQQSPGEVVAGTRAVEYPAGQISQNGFLNSAEKYLGPGYKELSPGRYVSADGMAKFGLEPMRLAVLGYTLILKPMI